MIYMSDHGEFAWGERPSTSRPPYVIARRNKPRSFIAWFRSRTRLQMGVDAGCLAKDADQPKSHDNLFHTVLGMMDVRDENL